jgi:uncharacterized protein (TIGR02246 family)
VKVLVGRIAVPVALTVALVSGIAGAQAPSPAQRQIQPLMDEFLAAANAHDTDRFLAPYVHDSTFIFAFNGTVVEGFAQMRAMQAKAWNNGNTDVVYSSRAPITYTALTPDVVVATWPMGSRRTLPTGEIKVTELVVTMTWQRRRDGWRVVQMHESSVR